MKIASTQYSLNTKSFEIYLSGCNGNPRCSGCHNPELWDFDLGQEYSQEYFYKIKDKITKFDSLIDNIMILGGEPLDQNHTEFTKMSCDLISLNKKIWLFTRYELDEISSANKILFDYIKTGNYIPELKTKKNIQYGIKLATSNQKINKRGIDY